MNKRLKTIIGAAMACCLTAMSLAACTGKNNDNTVDDVPPSGPPVVEPPTDVYDPDEYKDWGDAHWIWSDDKTQTGRVNLWSDFRRDFTLGTVPSAANVKIACDSKYRLFVNGQCVVFDGGVTRSFSDSTYYDKLDIAEYLQTGDNNICVLAWYWGTTSQMAHYVTSGKAGMILSSDIFSDGVAVSSGDGLWYGRNDGAFTQGGNPITNWRGDFNVTYDAQKEVDWTANSFDPAQNGWNKVVRAGKSDADLGRPGDPRWGKLIERPIPMTKDYGLTELPLEKAETGSTVAGKQYTFKLPYNMQISPYIVLGSQTAAGKTVSAQTETANNSNSRMTYITKAGAQRYVEKTWMNGDSLTFTVPDGVSIESLGYRQTGYNVSAGESTPFAGWFDSTLSASWEAAAQFNGGHGWDEASVSAENNFYDELWKKAMYTLYVSMREGYMDCPDRERGAYIGDAYNEIEEAFYVFGNDANKLSAKVIRDVCSTQTSFEKNGRTYYTMNCVVPSRVVYDIPMQELSAAVSAWNYYLYTGDKTLAVDCTKALYNYLTNYTFEESGDYAGTLKSRSLADMSPKNQNWVTNHLWTDWGNNQDVRVNTNCWWYMAATAVKNLAGVDGVRLTQAELAWLDEGLARVKRNFEKFWNAELKAYATEYDQTHWHSVKPAQDNSHLVDDRVNALAVVSGLADPAHYADIRNVFMGTDTTPAYQNASIFNEKLVLQAMYIMGYDSDAMVRMAKRFMTTVNDKTSSTLPEQFPGEDLNLAEGTKNHGWSGGALTALSMYAVGVQPTSPGYATWRIRPQLGAFEKVSACVPANIGNILLEASASEITVTAPAGGGEVWVPIREGAAVSAPDGASFKENAVSNGKEYAVYALTSSGTYTFTIS